VGCGGVGLQVVAAAHLAGASPIVAVDRLPEKLELARSRGATDLVDASAADAVRRIRRLSDGGVDHAFEVVGRPETIRLAWAALRPGGTAIVVGIAPIGVDVCVPAIDFSSEKSLRGSFYGSGNPADEIRELAQQAASGGLDVGGVVSHRTDLEGIEKAFERLRNGEGARTVVVIDPDLAEAVPGVPS
jgi:S-(hydroxymethyl)glutathione dehydrogenase/alcohol dehydrogenase